ncbi:MAG: hypothetical protein H0W67_06770 [Gemmatimonadales bacterium]|nr:hypothetical protein [Gemmatimonadales bacterium]
MTCDYNGWNDAPEDEREWFDQHPEIWLAAQAASEAPERRPRRSDPESTGPESPQ